MKGYSAQLILLLVATASGCTEPEDVEMGRLAMALTMPLADVNEVRSLGLYALGAVSPELECDEFYSGAVDPIAQNPETVLAVDFANIQEGSEEMSLTFRAVPYGEKTIIVEAYDGGGTRIFLGCDQVYIEEGGRTNLEITMSRDPMLPE